MEKLDLTLHAEDIDPWMWAIQLGLAALIARNLWSTGSYVYNRVRTLGARDY